MLRLQQLIPLVLEKLSKMINGLIILDNCGSYIKSLVEEDKVISFLTEDDSSKNGFSTLFISREQNWKDSQIHYDDAIEIPKLKIEEITEFIKMHTYERIGEYMNIVEDVETHCCGEPIILQTMLDSAVQNCRSLSEYVKMLTYEGNGGNLSTVYCESFSSIKNEATYVFMYFLLLCRSSEYFDLDTIRLGVEGFRRTVDTMNNNQNHMCRHTTCLNEILKIVEKYDSDNCTNPTIPDLMRTKLKAFAAPAWNLSLMEITDNGVRMHRKVQFDFFHWYSQSELSCKCCHSLPLCFISIIVAAAKHPDAQTKHLQQHAEMAMRFVFKHISKEQLALSDDVFELAFILHDMLFLSGSFGQPKKDRKGYHFDSAIAVLENIRMLKGNMGESAYGRQITILLKLIKSYLFQGSAEMAFECCRNAEEISRENYNCQLSSIIIAKGAVLTELDNYEDASQLLEQADRIEQPLTSKI